MKGLCTLIVLFGLFLTAFAVECPKFRHYRLYITADYGCGSTDGCLGCRIIEISDNTGVLTSDCGNTGACTPNDCGRCSASACDIAVNKGCVDCAFEGCAGTASWSAYLTGVNLPHWLQYSFDVPTYVSQYSVYAKHYQQTCSFKNWQLQGSSDGATWTALDSQIDQNVFDSRQSYSLNCDIPCAAGYGTVDSGATCTECADGFYKATVGNTACLACATNFIDCGGAAAGVVPAGSYPTKTITVSSIARAWW